ncbi:MAG: rhomboid family intramembrane serine protease [Promethearchaeota archaeon]|nr:MAG: rhomboid family intramembrane serine protease [Candidatus Lokiarchaeota archaeon]
MIFLTIKSIKESRLTLALLSVNVILFFIFGTLNYSEIFYSMILINENVVNQLEIWRLFTSMFIHADLSHLLSNMFGLLLFGSYVEQVFNKFHYVLIYFISGLIGNVFTLLLFPLNTISYGASGALFGLIGASFITIAYEKDRILLVIALMYLLYFIMSSFAPNINLWAHLFGLLTGLIISYIIKKTETHLKSREIQLT